MTTICCRKLFSQASTIFATIFIWMASNVVYYMVFEPSMAHMVSLFSVSLLMTIWFLYFRQLNPPTMRWGVLIGLAGGIVVLVRLQDAPFLLLPYGHILVRWIIDLRNRQQAHARQWFGIGATAMLVTAIAFVPQLLAWQILYGTWSVSPYLNEHDPAFYWLQPQIVGVLFSTFHGLFLWHPIFLLACVGLFLLMKRDRLLAMSFLILLGLEVYIVAAWWSWWQGDSFGGRMFLNATWIWVIGLAALLEQLFNRRLLAIVLIAGGLLIAWNGLSLAQYRLGFVPMSQPLTWEQMTVDRLRLPWLLLKRLP